MKRPRLSLRTLLLFSLFCGMCGVVYTHSTPWALISKLQHAYLFQLRESILRDEGKTLRLTAKDGKQLDYTFSSHEWRKAENAAVRKQPTPLDMVMLENEISTIAGIELRFVSANRDNGYTLGAAALPRSDIGVLCSREHELYFWNGSQVFKLNATLKFLREIKYLDSSRFALIQYVDSLQEVDVSSGSIVERSAEYYSVDIQSYYMTDISPDRSRVLMTRPWVDERGVWCRHRENSGLTQFFFPTINVQATQFASDSLILVSTGNSIELWHRRRHEAWWGIFEIWEFWLAVALLIVGLASLWKDQHALHKSPSAV